MISMNLHETIIDALNTTVGGPLPMFRDTYPGVDNSCRMIAKQIINVTQLASAPVPAPTGSYAECLSIIIAEATRVHLFRDLPETANIPQAAASLANMCEDAAGFPDSLKDAHPNKLATLLHDQLAFLAIPPGEHGDDDIYARAITTGVMATDWLNGQDIRPKKDSAGRWGWP